MSLARKMFHEIVISSILLCFFDALFTGILFFSFGFFLFAFFNLSFIVPILFAAIFFLFSFVKKLRQNKILSLEEKYPELKERLRTSRDYEDDEGPVAMALHTEVIGLVGKADINALINDKKLALKIMGISALFFLTLVFSSYGANITYITNKFSVRPDFINFDNIKTKAADLINNDINLVMTPDFLENGSSAKLGDEELNLTLGIYSTELDVSQIENPKNKEFGETFPSEDANLYAEETYDDSINDEYKSVIKKYFDSLKEK
ncbi:MAG: hypothetical protein KKF44_04780 [Nanoarchaeota archaeon]|nr:hypothetical protein [Nanoarchaeota archaeon]